jgi:hypothetical protein
VEEGLKIMGLRSWEAKLQDQDKLKAIEEKAKSVTDSGTSKRRRLHPSGKAS